MRPRRFDLAECVEIGYHFSVNFAPPTLRPLAACWLGAVMFASVNLRGQTNEASPVLTNIAQIRALGATQPRELKRPVHIRGVVIYVSFQRSHFFLQDDTAGILVPVANTNLCPNFGMDVEVHGITGNYGLQWGIKQGEFTVHGPRALPKPVKTTLADAQAIRYRSRWVEAEGIVLQVRKHKTPAIVFQLLDASGVSLVALTAPGESFAPTNLIGARVLLRGLNVRAEIAPLLVPEAKHISVIASGFTSPFAAPAATVSALRASGPKLDRVTLRGSVLRTIHKPSPQNGVYLRDDTGALQVTFLTPPPANESGYEPGEFIPIPEVHPGDLVEVVGSLTAIKPNVFLQHSQMRVLQSGPEPEPIIATPADIAADKFTSDLVTVRGRLLGRHEIATGRNFWRDVVRLSAGGHEVDVFIESNVSGRFALLSLNDLIEVRGVAVPDDGTALGSLPKEFSVQVASVADVRSLGLAPEIAQRRTFQLVGSVTVLVLLGGSWIALLRSRLARERRVAAERERSQAAIREANASLERRVAERTAELEKARANTARALEAERELNELKSRFVSIVSHEFRTPLGIIMSAVELLRNYQERLPTTKRDELHADIYGSTRQMAALMEQVLVLGRVEGGKLAFTPKPVDLAVFCGKLADESISATGRRCAIAVRVEDSLDQARGDEALMRHIFSNLLSNVVKYSPAGGNVEFAARRDGENAVFTVRDHGIGVPEADLPHLFEPFRRASNVGDTPGTGLGMLIVKRCVELQNGRLAIQSKVSDGTTVTVTLPLFSESCP